jgi:hypothetical protein
VLRIALVQVHIQNNKAMAVEHTLKLLRKVGSSDSDIACVVVTKILRLMWSKEVSLHHYPINNAFVLAKIKTNMVITT